MLRSSAQRLSASSEFALRVDDKAGVKVVCSTPFGIMGIRTDALGAGWVTIKMCSTPFGIIGIRTKIIEIDQALAQWCSTPCGIIGIRTVLKRIGLADDLVLNAFRHHRNSHSGSKATGACFIKCSTPFGIIGIRTWPRWSNKVVQSSAQRLSASSEFAPSGS